MRSTIEFHTKKKSHGASEDLNAPPKSESNHENRQPADETSSQSPEYFALAARATNDAIRDWNVTTGELAWPQGLERLLGHAASAATSRIDFWQQNIHAEDRARVATEIRDALNGSDNHWSGEYCFRRADQTYACILERALIVRDANGTALRFVGSLMDITARQQLQDQLARSQRMEAFGRLAAGVAHDFNNFLTTILGYSDLMRGELPAKSNVSKHIAEIQQAAGRASALTAQLLAFSRKHPLEPRVVEVNSVIVSLERSLLRLVGENISVVCQLHHETGGAHVRVDPGQLSQVLVNLAVNARDAMPTGGRLTLETSIVVIDEAQSAAALLQEVKPGDYVQIVVNDNGSGMSDEAKAHLFEPFFTTKEEGMGSGLGLATSYGIIRQSGGHIQIESERAQGTTVKILLPKVDAPARNYRKPHRLPTGKETILVLEDDISVRHVSVHLLRSLGYKVIEAASGNDAQRLFAQHDGKQIHLLLTDMVMPFMSGRSFADWLSKESPATRVVFVSGYLQESMHPGERAEPGMFFLPKPFDTEQLARTVREALDSAKTTR